MTSNQQQSFERPILFSAPMVRATLDGRKTVTRRAMKTQPALNGRFWEVYGAGWSADITSVPVMPGHSLSMNCPYGQRGDRLWVRETWLPDPDADHEAWDDHTETYVSWSGCGSRIDGVPPALRNPEHCIYREGWIGGGLVWRPSIHMPRWASRILLEITDVRVERLQDISHEQALAEGVKSAERDIDPEANDHSPYELFGGLWTMLNGMESWNANPWVWVIEFKRVTP